MNHLDKKQQEAMLSAVKSIASSLNIVWIYLMFIMLSTCSNLPKITKALENKQEVEKSP